MKLPAVVGISLCDRLHVDPDAGQVSLQGIFHVRQFPRFPTDYQLFCAYVLLVDGEGEGTIELVCTRLETEQDIYRYGRWYKFAGRGMFNHLEIPVKKCRFAAPGRYCLTLRFDREELPQRYFDIVEG